MKQIGRGIIRICTLAVALATGLVGSASAQDGTWTGAEDTNWQNTNNWVNYVVAGNWNNVFFDANTVNGAVSVNWFKGTAAITLASGLTQSITLLDGGQPLIKNGSGLSIAADSADLTINCRYWIWDTFETWNIGTGRTLTLNGAIGDTGYGIIKEGDGTAVLANTQIYKGSTIVKAGTLKTSASNAAGPGVMALASPTTWVLGADRQALAGLAGTGLIRSSGCGAVSTGTDGAAQISASKNYVLKLDFEPNGGGGASVNGVQFTGVNTTSGDGWALTGVPNPYGENGGLSGYDRLLSGFFYNGNPGVLTFSNLIVGKVYEAVIFSAPHWGTRAENAIFSNGTESQMLPNTDPGNYGYYAYRFKASASTASIAMYPLNTGNTFHWYGVTLEDLTGTSPSASTYSATLKVGDSSNHSLLGLIDRDISLVKQGLGMQTLAGTNGYTGGTTVNSGTLRTTAVNAAGSGAVDVAPAATWQIWDGADQTVAGLSGAGTIATVSGGVVSTGADGVPQISVANTYVHLLDFGNAGGATVNGVAFTDAGTSGTGWSLAGTPNLFTGGDSGYNQLMNDFYYGGNPATLTFSDLVVGKMYDAVLYTRVGFWPDRWQDATFANGTSSIQLLNTDPGTVGYYSYQFVASDPTATITMVPINPGNTFHWFAASLADITPAGINTYTGGVTLTVGDTKDHRFAGTISGDISLVKQGSGTQSLAGTNTYTGDTIIIDGTLKMELPSPPPAGEVTFDNMSFEVHEDLVNGSWGYNPTNATWTFDMGSGISAANGAWVAGGAAIDGSYSAFVQNNGIFSQPISVSASGSYLLTFKAANRPGFFATGVDVKIDGVTVRSFAGGEFVAGAAVQTFTAPVELTAGTHTLAFAGVQSGDDTATAIDRVAFTAFGELGGFLPVTTSVKIDYGSWLDLGGTTQTVSRLYFDGNEKQPGTHGSAGSGATYTHANWITGTGILNVLYGKFPGLMIMFK